MTKGYRNKISPKPRHSAEENNNAIELQKKTYNQNEKSDSTSSSTTTESTDFSVNQEEELEVSLSIFDTLYDTSDESYEALEEEEKFEDSQQKYQIEDLNFFENFTQLPDIVDISEDLSNADGNIETKISIEDPSKDVGHFVDPLTGLELQSHSGSSTKILNDTTKDATVEESSNTVSQQSEISDIFIPEEESFLELQRTSYDIEEQQTKDLFETFMELDLTKAEETSEEYDWLAIIKEQEAKRLHQQTIEFINDLIHKVVQKAEYISPEDILRQNLDKHKLVQEISRILQQQRVEIKVSEFLNRKVVEFFKRKQIYRPIIPENLKILSQEKENYMKNVKRLDNLLGKENYVRDSTTLAVKNLRDELSETEQKVQNEILKFESMVMKNLARDVNTQQYNNILEILLRRMSKYRKEVSDVRFQMIIKQHTHAILLEKLAVLEDLGNDLTMKDYDNIQTENITLDKKIEERNIDLKKLHLRSCHSLHLLANFKEKQRMFIDMIDIQRNSLTDLLEERSSLRKYVYHLKLKRAHIRQELKELSIQGGLLDKPALMYDYDQNEKRLSELREVVNRLRFTLETIQQKINKLEKRLTVTNNHSFSLII